MTADTAPETMWEGRFIKMVKQGKWEYASRCRGIEAAVIVAITDADEVILVEQYRVPLKRTFLELPAGLIGDVVIDAKTGVSGAGRAATDETHFVSVDENVSAYKVAGHRHAPEIDQELAVLGAPVTVTFVPHLVPLDQGELISAYVASSRDVSEAELRALFEDAYADEPFVELAERPPGTRDVQATNICRISVHGDRHDGRVLVFAAIDNLWKGAAGQAIQNLNLMLGLDEGDGLL